MPENQSVEEGTAAQQQQQQSTQQQAGGNATQPYVTKDELQSALREAVQESGLLDNKSSGVSQEDVQKLLQTERTNILKDLGKRLVGEEEKPEINPLTRAMLLNSEDYTNLILDTARQIAQEEIKSVQTMNDELMAATAQIRRERPDIAQSDQGGKLFNRIFKDLTDPTKPVKERVNDALNQFDSLLSDGGFGSKEDRIKKAQTSLDSTHRGAHSDSEESKADAAKILQDELDDRVARSRKLRNLD